MGFPTGLATCEGHRPSVLRWVWYPHGTAPRGWPIGWPIGSYRPMPHRDHVKGEDGGQTASPPLRCRTHPLGLGGWGMPSRTVIGGVIGAVGAGALLGVITWATLWAFR